MLGEVSALARLYHDTATRYGRRMLEEQQYSVRVTKQQFCAVQDTLVRERQNTIPNTVCNMHIVKMYSYTNISMYKYSTMENSIKTTRSFRILNLLLLTSLTLHSFIFTKQSTDARSISNNVGTYTEDNNNADSF